MFKKPSDVKAQQRLSGADRKKLRRCIRERFASASDSDIDIILPPKAEITVLKLTNKVHVYTVEGGHPMLFDVDGRGSDIFPTVFALWKVPALLPAFVLKGGEVSRFVLGGADLMFPGISIPPEGLPSFTAGEPWSVIVPGNAFPIAVGATLMSSEQAFKAGFRGKALRILHYYRDTLWESADGRYVPNAGFHEDVVSEDPSDTSISNASESQETEVVNVHEGLEPGNDGDQPEVQNDIASESNPERVSKSIANDNGLSSESIKDLEELKVTDEIEETKNAKGLASSVCGEEMDALLDKCLLQALYTSVKDKDLPIPGSTLWSNYILACRPPGITLDIKKSSYKKLSKWLLAKASTGLVAVKEDKHKKEIMLMGINRAHPDYQLFKPEKTMTDMAETSVPVACNDPSEQGLLEIVELWKSSTHVTPIIKAVGADPNRHFTASEAANIVFSYVEKENLVNPNSKSIVVLNAVLCDALFKGTVKKGSRYPTEIHKKDLGSTFISRMHPYYRLTRGDEKTVKKGTLKPVQIMTERRQGNKKVTRVSGLESYLVDADGLASELQKKFACSTTVAELPGKKGQNEVLVQGGVIDDLAKHLVQQYGISKKYIEILDKTKK